MRYRPLAALIVVPALAGCGSSIGVTTGETAQGNRAPKTSISSLAPCQKTDRAKPVSDAPGARSALVSANALAVQLCRYSGLNGHPRMTLIGQRTVTDPATVARLAHALDALPKSIPGAVNCPADFGDAIIAVFAYPTGGADPVTVGLSGCQDVSNGHVHRLAGLARSPIAAQLAAQTSR
jgi:hypothetical protein